MSTILTQTEIEHLRIAGRKLVAAFEAIRPLVVPGANLLEIEKAAEAAILAQGGVPSFKGYEGYPSALCLSLESQVVHCVPTDQILQEGDILAVDMGVSYEGIHTDAAVTWPVGEVSEEKQRLLTQTYAALLAGTSQVKPGIRVDQISKAIEEVARAANLTIFKQFVGHGIGHELHEDPYIPNFNSGQAGPILAENQAIAIEPITGLGVDQIVTSDDGWTVTTVDGRPSAHFEHTILLTGSGFEVITPLETLVGGQNPLTSRGEI